MKCKVLSKKLSATFAWLSLEMKHGKVKGMKKFVLNFLSDYMILLSLGDKTIE